MRIQSGNASLPGRVAALVSVGLFAALSLALGLAPRSAAAEPDDSILSASGPLAINQTYTASLETAGDRDVYFFYVTSPSSPTTLTLGNLGGSTAVSYISARIMDSSATVAAAVSYINKGESGTTTVALEPQKYFIEVAANEGSGDSYSITTGGSGGAFGPYSSIAVRCTRASSTLTKAKARLRRAESKLQRATARLRRSRYSSPEARDEARNVHRRAKASVASKRAASKAARAARSPWCFISQ